MQLPGPVRAAVGLVASAADEAKRLPDRAIELPMLAVSTALQASLRAQQRYARLTARGDAVLSRSRPTDEPPTWATFDDPVTRADAGAGAEPPQFGTGDLGRQLADELFGDSPSIAPESEQYSDGSGAAVARAPSTRTPAGTSPKPGKAVSAPRHIPPSPFDEAAFDEAAFDEAAFDEAGLDGAEFGDAAVVDAVLDAAIVDAVLNGESEDGESEDGESEDGGSEAGSPAARD